MEYRKCFIPTCKNDSKNSPDKIFVRIREDLKDKWCREAKAECFKIYRMYCCEDHLEPREDLINYYKCKLLNEEPRLKRSALLRNIGQDTNEGLSELNKLLLQPPSTSQPLKRKRDDFDKSKSSTSPNKSELFKRIEDIAMPSTSTCSTLDINIDAATQCEINMVYKSTNYKTRKQPAIIITTDILQSSRETSSAATPSSFGCTSVTEESSRLRDPSEANSNDTELETSSDETDVETEQPISSGNTSPYQQCNAQVTHAEKIQEDVTKAFIAKVFHYLEHEFEVLKKMDAEMILSNLSKLLYRTAMATGVSETTVLEILQEEARRSAGTQESGSQGELQVPVEFTGQPRKPTRKRRRVYKKQNLDESSSEASDGSIEEVASSSIAQDTTIEPDGELMVMKAEPFEYYNEEPAINIQPVNPTAVNKEQTQVDPISLDVKEESADDDELNDCIETLARQSASSRRRTYGKRDVISTHGQNQMDPDSSDVKMEQPDGQTRRQEDYCTPGTSRSHRPVIELDGRCLLRVGAVKEESENEEGFS